MSTQADPLSPGTDWTEITLIPDGYESDLSNASIVKVDENGTHFIIAYPAAPDFLRFLVQSVCLFECTHVEEEARNEGYFCGGCANRVMGLVALLTGIPEHPIRDQMLNLILRACRHLIGVADTPSTRAGHLDVLAQADEALQRFYTARTSLGVEMLSKDRASQVLSDYTARVFMTVQQDEDIMEWATAHAFWGVGLLLSAAQEESEDRMARDIRGSFNLYQEALEEAGVDVVDEVRTLLLTYRPRYERFLEASVREPFYTLYGS